MARSKGEAATVVGPLPSPPAGPTVPIADLVWREQATVAGRVRSICVQPRAGIATLEATLWDATGGVTLIWLGRREIAGVRPGAHLRVSGVVGDQHNALAFLNPDITIEPAHH